MIGPKEGSLFSSITDTLGSIERQDLTNYEFSMLCNGYVRRGHGWHFDDKSMTPFASEFKGQHTSFFGPLPTSNFFANIQFPEQYARALQQDPAKRVIGKYRHIDEDQAARIAYLLGGIIRYYSVADVNIPRRDKISHSVDFTSQMAVLGGKKSGDAITSAMSMFIISDGSPIPEPTFRRNTQRMANAIDEDPIIPDDTVDLGYSQVTRLRHFNGEEEPYKNIHADLQAFENFPTLGAEFHFPESVQSTDFLKKLALLNMSQYQRGSYVQFSRNDRNVIEVRMNPSVLPVTIANWNHMRKVLPELNDAFYTMTLNRKSSSADFSWTNADDKAILEALRTLGMLTYSVTYSSVPPTRNLDEINFGSVYLGQTVKIDSGKYNLTGGWHGGEGKDGQFGIYVGYGLNFPLLAYYLSMGLAKPDILKPITSTSLNEVKTLHQALAVGPDDCRRVFAAIKRNVFADDTLRNAAYASSDIMSQLNPTEKKSAS